MNLPESFFYTKDHEWAHPTGDGVVTVGITEHAQSALGEVVFAELPSVGRTLSAHETFGVVESIKAVSDLYAPVSGEVVEINGQVASDPSLINRSPHKDGWLVKIRLADQKELQSLMKSEQYRSHVESLGG